MSFLNTLKELATVALDAVKENPVAAAAIGGGALVIGGGGIYAKRRYSAHKAAKASAAAPAAVVAPVAAITPVAAPEAAPEVVEDPGLLAEKFQHPEREQGTVK